MRGWRVLNKLRQIKFKLPLFMLILLVLPSTITGIISYQQTEILERVTIDKAELESLGSKYEGIFDEYDTFIDDLSQMDELQYDTIDVSADSSPLSNMPMANNSELTHYYEQFLSDLSADKEYLVNMFIGTTGGALYLDNIPEDVNLLGYDPRNADWYNEAVNTRGEVIWTTPYIDTATGAAVITAARTISDESGQTIGVVGLDFDSGLLAGMVRQDILFSTISTTVISILIGLTIVIFFVKTLLYNLKTLGTEMNRVADGDLSGQPVKTKGKDEFNILADAVNRMKENLTSMISNVTNATDKVAEQSGTLSKSADQVKEGSEQIAATMEELSSGSESQANSASDLATMMETYNKNVLTASTDSEQIAKNSMRVLELSNDGAEQIELSVDQMHTIHEIVRESLEKVKGLDVKSQEIGKIVSVIQEIADQTNLLALNAAIEAARAGEEGKGFAVVADEVRKLAEQVSNSVTGISSIVTSIQNESSEVATSLETGYQEVDKGTNQIETTGQSFQQINGSISEMVEKVQTIVSDLSGIASDSESMNRSVDEIASVSQESAAAVEETAASAEETNSSMEEVSRSAVELEELATLLENQVAKFKL